MEHTELLTMYSELIKEIKIKFPKMDLKLIFELMSHRLLHPDHKPVTRLEIFYKPNVDLDQKARRLEEITGVVATIYRDEHRLTIEPRIEFEDLEALKDDDMESLAGDIICCLDTILSRRKIAI